MVRIVSNSSSYHTPQDVYVVIGSRNVHRVHRHWKDVTWGGLVAFTWGFLFFFVSYGGGV